MCIEVQVHNCALILQLALQAQGSIFLGVVSRASLSALVRRTAAVRPPCEPSCSLDSHRSSQHSLSTPLIWPTSQPTWFASPGHSTEHSPAVGSAPGSSGTAQLDHAPSIRSQRSTDAAEPIEHGLTISESIDCSGPGGLVAQRLSIDTRRASLNTMPTFGLQHVSSGVYRSDSEGGMGSAPGSAQGAVHRGHSRAAPFGAADAAGGGSGRGEALRQRVGCGHSTGSGHGFDRVNDGQGHGNRDLLRPHQFGPWDRGPEGGGEAALHADSSLGTDPVEEKDEDLMPLLQVPLCPLPVLCIIVNEGSAPGSPVPEPSRRQHTCAGGQCHAQHARAACS